ncbi:MAG: S8 family serine peptidase [Anaerolineae bacterium]|nr:S8 family serine peptidase [Anaerolineae bacterium]
MIKKISTIVSSLMLVWALAGFSPMRADTLQQEPASLNYADQPGNVPGRAPEKIPDEIAAEFENMTVQEFLTRNKGPVPHALQQFDETPIVVIVEMEGAPLAQVYAETIPDGIGAMSALAQQDYVQSLAAAQEVVASGLMALGGQIIDQYTKAYNGILAQLPTNQQAAAAQLPGVKAIHEAPLHYPSLENSVPLINADSVWGDLGFMGEGVTIAIIDSGIDYTHAAFGGIGTAAAYADNDPTIITSTPAQTETFPMAKVVGGYDFAGTDYNPGAGVVVPVPDDDPLDEQGHGTHVASIAAGFQVPGNIGAGVAPSATLYALKVFGAQGGTNLTIGAIEWAMDPNDDGNMSDHVDVINLSLGGSFEQATDPDAVAADNAAAAGIVVVCAAGNSGNTYYVMASPAAADAAIAVAASTITDTVGSFSSRGPRGPDSHLKPEITAPGVAIVAAEMGGGDTGVAKNGTSMAAPHIAGVAALMRQAHPTWTVEQIKAAMMNTATQMNDESPIPRVGAGRVDAYFAISADTVAIGDDDLVSLSWGFVPVGTDSYSDIKTITLNNFAGAKTYALAYYPGYESPIDGFDLSVPAIVDVGAGTETSPASVTVPVTLTLDPAALPLDFGSTLEEFSGIVYLENTVVSTDTLVIPVYAVPRPYSQLALDISFQGYTTTVALTHTGPVSSALQVFPAYAVDAEESSMPDEGDIRFVAMDYDFDDPTYGDLFAAVFATWGPWHTPQAQIAEFALYLDVDNDGSWDFVDFNLNLANFLTGGAYQNDEWVVIQRDLSDNSLDLASPYPILSDFNAGVMWWRLSAAWHGLGGGGGDTDLVFSAVSWVDANVDGTGSVHSFDYARLPYGWWTWGDPGPADRTSTVTVVGNGTGTQGFIVVDWSGEPGQGQVYHVPLYFVYLPSTLKETP